MKKSLLLCLLLTIVFTAKAQDLIRFDSEGKVGFKNDSGEIIVPAIYYYSDYFPNKLIRINLNNKYGFIDITGKIIIPAIYDKSYDFIEEYCIVCLNKKVFNNNG